MKCEGIGAERFGPFTSCLIGGGCLFYESELEKNIKETLDGESIVFGILGEEGFEVNRPRKPVDKG
ncbi:hypothetical protein [Rathayibacter tritici]|uniref:hypothetical protein n=1 Tax=Rathayibacter tritici TaxID=33888 RepID=UPI00082E4BB5|nr:hypothetical protein [Rathayibacter tritici]